MGSKGGEWFFWVNHALFLLTALGTNLVSEELDYQGAGETRTALINTSTYVGQVVFCYLYDPYILSEINWRDIWSVRTLCIAELLGSIFYQLGIYMIGAGLHILIYSFVTVYCAIANYLLYNKRLNTLQCLGIICVTVFIVVSGLGQLELPQTDTWKQIIGMTASILSTMCFGHVYVLTNVVLERRNGPSAGKLGMMIGIVVLGILGVYEMLAVIPNWTKLVVDPIKHENRGATMVEIMGMYACLTLMNGLHQLSFYLVMSSGPSSAIAGGINKALTAVILFFMAHHFFCQKVVSTCLSNYKVVGAIGVVFSILFYTYVTPTKPSKNLSGTETDEEAILMGSAQEQISMLRRRKSQPITIRPDNSEPALAS